MHFPLHFYLTCSIIASPLKVIIRLVRTLDTIKEPAARSLIIWIFGEYSSTGNLIPKIAPAVLKYLAWSFAAEVLETKLQILNTCAKVYPNFNIPALKWTLVIGLSFRLSYILQKNT